MKPSIPPRFLTAVFAGSCLLAGACSSPVKHAGPGISPVHISNGEAKNVILFIRDGMGISTVTAIRILDGQMKGMSGEENILSWEKSPNVALSKTYGIDLQVGESAEDKGMSTGVISTARLTHATPASTYAHVTRRGWESDIDLSDEAKQEGCSDIAAQLLDFSYGNGIEVAMGGGRLNFFPAGSTDPEGADTAKGRQDNRNLTQQQPHGILG